MSIDNLSANQRAQDLFEGILRQVPEAQHDGPSACERWTIRDVVGHVVWGRRLLASCAAGEEDSDRRGAPGAERPSELIEGDLAAAFAEARKACDAALTPEGLTQPAPAMVRKANPEATVEDFLPILTADLVVHSWDIANRTDLPLDVDEETLAVAMEATSGGVRRSPDFFGAEIPAPPDGDRIEQFMAYLGRESRRTTDWSADNPNPS